MRKSIFLTAILALFISAVFGQATHNSKPIPLTGCQDDALHPIAGKSYNYKVEVNPTGGNFQWWATKDMNFIKTDASGTTNNSNTALTTSTGLMDTGANYATTSTEDNVDITWGTDILGNTVSGTNPTFVTVQYDAPTGSCANNLKVYQIDPINAFTVDVLNMTDKNTPMTDGSGTEAYGSVFSTCVSDVANATYDVSQKKVVYDYGDNKLYYEVVAANFSGSYTPTFQLEGLEAGQTADIKWGYTKGNYDKTLQEDIAGGSTFSKTSTDMVKTDATNTNEGVSIYVEVIVHNGTYENPTPASAQAIKLAVTGENTAGQNDSKNDECGTDATFADNTAEQQLNPRPGVTSQTTGGDFIPAN